MEIYNQLGTAPVPQKDLQYWNGTGDRYHASTEIYTVSVLPLLRSRLLADTWSQNWSSTMPILRQPSARYQLSNKALLLVYNWRGTVPFVNTGMNRIFSPGNVLSDHRKEFADHDFDWNNVEILYSESNKGKREFMEILCIKIEGGYSITLKADLVKYNGCHDSPS